MKILVFQGVLTWWLPKLEVLTSLWIVIYLYIWHFDVILLYIEKQLIYDILIWCKPYLSAISNCYISAACIFMSTMQGFKLSLKYLYIDIKMIIELGSLWNCWGLGLCYMPRPSASTDYANFCLHKTSYLVQRHSIIILHNSQYQYNFNLINAK